MQFNDLMAKIASQVYNNDGTITNQHLIVLDLDMVPKNRWQTRSTRAICLCDANVFSKGLRYAAHATATYSSDKSVI